MCTCWKKCWLIDLIDGYVLALTRHFEILRSLTATHWPSKFRLFIVLVLVNLKSSIYFAISFFLTSNDYLFTLASFSHLTTLFCPGYKFLRNTKMINSYWLFKPDTKTANIFVISCGRWCDRAKNKGMVPLFILRILGEWSPNNIWKLDYWKTLGNAAISG